MKNSDRMLVDVYLTKVETGETVKFPEEVYIDEVGIPSVFIWEDGNYSCDCNRFLFFERAKGNNPDWEDAKCGEGKYKVKLVNPIQNQVLYFEDGAK